MLVNFPLKSGLDGNIRWCSHWSTQKTGCCPILSIKMTITIWHNTKLWWWLWHAPAWWHYVYTHHLKVANFNVFRCCTQWRKTRMGHVQCWYNVHRGHTQARAGKTVGTCAPALMELAGWHWWWIETSFTQFVCVKWLSDCTNLNLTHPKLWNELHVVNLSWLVIYSFVLNENECEKGYQW